MPPLRRCKDNPRYFADETGKAVYLTGLHTWNNFQCNQAYPRVDYKEYLDLLEHYHHNFIRLWAWEQASRDPFCSYQMSVEPNAFQRTGPGNALDGKPRFDLTKFNPAYFSLLRDHVQRARDRGIYVSVMLFEGWSIEKKGQVGNPWKGHPFNRDNNINGIEGDPENTGEGKKTHTLTASGEILEIQKSYVRKVIDTLNDMDNLLYEISNEDHENAVVWQYAMIDFIHEYERKKGRQHPVGMTGACIKNPELFKSPADWVGVTSEDGYNSDPPAADGSKVVLSDVDHVWPKEFQKWVWKSFCRGLNTAFMDLYGATEIGDPRPDWWKKISWAAETETTRRNMGHALRYAEKINLNAMVPQGELSSTQYCLAHPGSEYLVFQPAGGPFQLDLAGITGTFSVEWFYPENGNIYPGENITSGARANFAPLPSGSSVVYLKKM